MNSQSQNKPDILRRAAAVIIDYRFVVFALFAAVLVYCVLSIGKVQVTNDMTTFLPAGSETRRALAVMEEEFVEYDSENVMVANVTYETAQRLAEEIGGFEGVTGVTLDDTAAHYANASALLTVGYDGTEDDPVVIAAKAHVREYLAAYDVYTAQLAEEMVTVMLLASAVVVLVLLFSSRSYFELVIFAIVFVVAALMNMGTNFWLGEISSITSTIAVIMQLALAIDYAIILCHRYHDEAEVREPGREALTEALAQAIVEISSSSLTTIAGLLALTLMQFGLGRDLGLVLAKSILCSMLTVFLLMPGLIMLFPRALKKTLHRSLIPDIRPWGRFLSRFKSVFVWVFILILPAAFWGSRYASFVFSDRSIDELVYSESRANMHKIVDTFAYSTNAAVLVPRGDYESERALLKDIEALDGVKSVTGLAGIEIDDGHVLTDSYTPRMLSELLSIDAEEAVLLYELYGYENGQYALIFSDPSEQTVPLVDMLLYLFEKSDEGILSLEGEQAEQLSSLRDTLRRGVEQLRGESWSRMVITISLPPEGDESVALVEEIRALSEGYYGEGNIMVAGDITSARDLRLSYSSDMLLITLLTDLFVFFILLFTVRSLVGSLLLVFVIQGSIWINFAFIWLTGLHTTFMVNMIVSAIQMGATIDYAIVLMNRYLGFRQSGLGRKQAMVEAVNHSFATIVTSGTIMTLAGFLLAWRITDVYVGHIGLAVGRGALISSILVLTVLPQLVCLLDGAIEKTSFARRKEAEA